MRCKALICALAGTIAMVPLSASGGILQSAESFTVLGASAVTNTGATTIAGDLGVYPGNSISGIGTITLLGALHAGDAVSQLAHADTTTAYNGLANMSSDFNLTGQDLGGLTLTSGVYTFNSTAQLTGTLTLDAQGMNNAYWVFQIGSSLTTASASVVQVINAGSNGGTDNGLFWQIGSSATLGTTTAFEGNILALASITLNTSATIHNGRALALTGAVTMDNNTLSKFSPPPDFGTMSGGLRYNSDGSIVPIGLTTGTAVPEPTTWISAMIAGTIGLAVLRKSRLKTA
jgi:type VI secretion system secreted protein VgrG